MNQSLHDYSDEEGELQKKKSRFNINDSMLNAEAVNFAKLDHMIEGETKNRYFRYNSGGKPKFSPTKKRSVAERN